MPAGQVSRSSIYVLGLMLVQMRAEQIAKRRLPNAPRMFWIAPHGHVDQLLEEIGARVGQQLDLQMRANQNVSLRYKSIGGMAYRVNDLLFRYAPKGLHETVKKAALPLLAKKNDAASESGLLDLPEVRAFVAHHYAADSELYRNALASRSGSITP